MVSASAEDIRGRGALFVKTLDNIRFNSADQQSLSDSLKDELIRLGIFSSVASAPSNQSAQITVEFTSSNFAPQPFPEYEIEFTVAVTTINRAPLKKSYVVHSLDGLSTSKKWNINAPKSKLRAAELALAKVIPDIESYLAGT